MKEAKPAKKSKLARKSAPAALDSLLEGAALEDDYSETPGTE